MAYTYNSLGDFISSLKAAGELATITVEVDPVLEISEITDRVSKKGGPALLFTKPRGSSVPLLINAFGSYRRTAMALGVESVEEIAQRIDALLELRPPSGLLNKLKMLPKLGELGALAPKTVSSGPCQEVVETEFSLFEFPILQCWPQDAGRFITLPLVFSKHPVTGKRNCGVYRMQLFDE
ncbi:MAG TPA: UbiD family decarboxylase, partial [Acidobacteriota bacterium]|nr:UbiD family decarboxylase [Acidobacteriota bacterium]